MDLPASSTGAITDGSLGLCSNLYRGTMLVFVCCEFVWVGAAASEMASLLCLVLDMNFPLKRPCESPTEMH